MGCSYFLLGSRWAEITSISNDNNKLSFQPCTHNRVLNFIFVSCTVHDKFALKYVVEFLPWYAMLVRCMLWSCDRLSVTRWYCTKMAKLRITHIMPHDSPGGGAVVSLEWVKLDTSGLIFKIDIDEYLHACGRLPQRGCVWGHVISLKFWK